MGYRLSKITTRTGDAGTTGLGDGSRVAKDSARIHAIGEVDELNSQLGVLLVEPLPDDVAGWLAGVQHDLFGLGGELAVPGYVAILDAHILRLEDMTRLMNAELSPLKEFILPGGSRAAALAHVVRAVARRAERAVVALGGHEAVSAQALAYLNRLSDMLFVLARYLNHRAGCTDVLWTPGRDAGVQPD